MKSAVQFEIPRCYFSHPIVRTTLIGFCEGSSKAYAAVIYVKFELENGMTSAMLVGSKARVAPLGKSNSSPYTVPRLELLGCLILSRFMETVKNAFKADIGIPGTRFYTDSTINLYRIKGLNKEYKQFVQNRLHEIRNKTSIDDWYYVPPKLNPSDLPTRGCVLSVLNANDSWLYGPEFIRKPDILECGYSNDVMETEVKYNSLATTEKNVKQQLIGMIPSDYIQDIQGKSNLANIIDLSRFNDFHKMLRVTSYVFRCINRSAAVSIDITRKLNVAKLNGYQANRGGKLEKIVNILKKLELIFVSS